MKQFHIRVTEIVTNEVDYVVEAATAEEALEKAENGDTIQEGHVRINGVSGREVDAESLRELKESEKV